MLKVNDIIICAYGADVGLTTHGKYKVVDTRQGVGVVLQDITGKHVDGVFKESRFMKESDMIEQVLENAKHG